MPSRLEEGLPTLAPSRAAASKQLFDRDPLLIPAPGAGKPWYRKRAVWYRLIARGMIVLLTAYTLHWFTLERILRRFARMF
jgi:hypothetical protein